MDKENQRSFRLRSAAGVIAFALMMAQSGPALAQNSKAKTSLFASQIAALDKAVEDENPEQARKSTAELRAALEANPQAPADQRIEVLEKLQDSYLAAGDRAAQREVLVSLIAETDRADGPDGPRGPYLLGLLANNYAATGDVAAGTALLNQAITERGKGNPLRAIELHQGLAQYLSGLSRLAGAAAAWQNVLNLQLTAVKTDPEKIAETTGELAQILQRLGRYDEAITLLKPVIKQAEERWRATGASETYNGDMTSLAKMVIMSNLQISLAEAYSGKGELEQSDAVFQAVRETRERYFTGPTVPLITIYNQMAFRQNFEGRFFLAEENARKALDLYESVHGGEPYLDNDLNYAKLRYNLASALLGQDKAEEALPLLRFGLPMARAQLTNDAPDMAILLSTLSRAEIMAGKDWDQATGYAREAVAIARKHRDARLAGGYGDDVTAVGEGSGLAGGAATRAIAGGVTVRDPLAIAYAALIDVAAAQLDNSIVSTAQLPLASEAFVAAQDLEQSVAGQAMAEAAARAFAGPGPLGQLITRKQELTAAIRDANAALTSAMAAQRVADATNARQLLEERSRELAGVDSEIKAQFPEFDRLVSPAGVSIADVQARLKADEAVMMIVPNGDRIYSFAISPAGVVMSTRLQATEPVIAAVKRLRCRVDEASCSDDADMDPVSLGSAELTGVDAFFPRFDRQTAFELYENLIEPLEPVLTKTKRIFAVTSGPISGLPLSMLVTRFDPKTDKAEDPDAQVLRNTAWLGDKYAFVTLPAVSVLRATRPASYAGKGVAFLGYGAPVLDGDGETAARSASSSGRAMRRKLRSGVMNLGKISPDTLRKLVPLPGTAAELKTMATALKVPDSSLRLGASATEAAVRADPALANARIVAFATHGILPRELGGNDEPGLVFTPPATAAAPPANDGFLSASEAAALKLNADWLILSACNTASSDGTPGAQSLSGLAKAFLHAGAKALLASNWRVSDEITAVLTVETMRLAVSGTPRAEALRQAMIAVRTGKRADGTAIAGWQPHWSHPAGWAPFVVVAADGN